MASNGHSNANGSDGNPFVPTAAAASASHIGNLSRKVALITGASSGLGRAIAQAYSAAGAFVVSADLSPNPPKAPILSQTLQGTDLETPTVDLLNATRPASAHDGLPQAIFVETNVSIPTSVEAAVAAAVAQYGRLDIMVNCAGIAAESTGSSPGLSKRIHETDDAVWDRDMAVNGKGVWLGCKYACAQMLAQPPHQPSGDRGWIINISSILGLVGMSGTSCYCATKGAVLQLTKAVALEYAKDKIHVNAIHPGFTETSMLEPMFAGAGSAEMHGMLESVHPWGRLGRPEDIAKAAVFLAGDGASWVTGQSLVVDGGYVAQ